MEKISHCSARFEPYRLVFLQSVRCNIGLTLLLLTPIFIFCSFAPAQGQNESDKAISEENWISTWGCAPAFPIGQEMANQTLRQFVRISVGGQRVRIRLSNETGTQPLVIGASHKNP